MRVPDDRHRRAHRHPARRRGAGPFGLREAGLALLVLIGSIAAHAGNNLLNDYIDVHEGIDRAGYFRTEYAPHPILSGQLSKNQVLFGAALLHAVDLVVLVVLIAAVGWGIAGFALAGLFLSIAYVAPPLSFKRRGLGELTAAVVWGPLMIVGAYYALRGAAPAVGLADVAAVRDPGRRGAGRQAPRQAAAGHREGRRHAAGARSAPSARASSSSGSCICS